MTEKLITEADTEEREVSDECDRCDDEIEGFEFVADMSTVREKSDIEIDREEDELVIATAGFYYTDTGPFADYTDDNEDIICDECMLGDEGYQEDYAV